MLIIHERFFSYFMTKILGCVLYLNTWLVTIRIQFKANKNEIQIMQA